MDDTSKHTVLVVEDERPLMEAIRNKLEKNNLEVVTARSVEQALGYMTDSVKVDAVWLDHYLLGKETGLDFVAKLKEDHKFKKVPIFVVSNTGSPDKKHTYLRLGAVKYYVKADHRLDSIVQEVKKYLENPKD
jgi:DNA-binding response OmpR family regulator